MGQRETYYEMRYRIDAARSYPTATTRDALRRALDENPGALRSRHILWGLGQGRIEYLRKSLNVAFDLDIYDWMQEKGLV